MSNNPNKSSTCVATIGFFDGVHRGHQFVIGSLARLAHQRGTQSVVVTFDRHPREVLSTDGQHPLCQPLTTLSQKQQLILAAGADRCEVLHFDLALAALPARTFMDTVLRQQLGCEALLIGYDNRFGRRDADSTEGFDDYVAYGRQLGIEVIQATPCPGAESISSSFVRRMLREGQLARANQSLGRPYSITGRVVHGHAEGRKLGFPTANLSPQSIPQLIPASGVYAVTATLGDATASTTIPAMLNIGSRPTFNGHEVSIEAHLFDFHADLYGQQLTLSFHERIREERPFDSPESLRLQLEKDKAQVQQILQQPQTRN